METTEKSPGPETSALSPLSPTAIWFMRFRPVSGLASDKKTILFSHLPMYFYTVAFKPNMNSLTVAGAAPALSRLIFHQTKCTGFPFNPDPESSQGTCSNNDDISNERSNVNHRFRDTERQEPFWKFKLQLAVETLICVMFDASGHPDKMTEWIIDVDQLPNTALGYNLIKSDE